ncbi:PP2C family protein-serine/threonine phosphatase [Cellulosimicrobium cellulans]|uniref:PP2C family protein-serine/threonine phosphatase n=1 Tax=Cellulosimicrobium cellulans TaxID=1710 RepID=UPI001112ECA0|nr:SpoIIE family protein phosphatase [Cellulosimicrobium cellulans]
MRTTAEDLDYHAIFSALTAPKLVLSSELMVLDANDAFLRTIDEPASAIVGRHYLDVFPLHTEEGTGAAEVVASFDRVRATGRLEMIGPHRYDLRDANGRWTERWWITTNVPVTDATGRVSVIVHRAEDVTDIVQAYGPVRARDTAAAGEGRDGADAGGTGAVDDGARAPSVLDRVLTVGSTVRRYTAALVRERRAALELQDSILTPPPEAPGLRIDVRYRPAVPEVHVGGDWYDAFVQPDGHTAVVVGDVTGHDVSAAARMGHLRGVVRSVGYCTGAGPATVLDTAESTASGLGLDALATAVVARVGPGTDGGARSLTWASAGHLPPVVRRADGSARLLEAPSDPLLGLGLGGDRSDHADVLEPGDTLLLYTDGLIERRDRPLRDSLRELPECVASLGDVPPGRLLDALLTYLVPAGTQDDVALLAVHVER